MFAQLLVSIIIIVVIYIFGKKWIYDPYVATEKKLDIEVLEEKRKMLLDKREQLLCKTEEVDIKKEMVVLDKEIAKLDTKLNG